MQEPPVQPPPPPVIFRDPANRATSSLREWRRLLRWAMVCFTVLWVAASGFLLLSGIVNMDHGVRDLGNGNILLADGRAVDRSAYLGGQLAGVLVLAALPIAPFFIAMIVAGVLYFAARDD